LREAPTWLLTTVGPSIPVHDQCNSDLCIPFRYEPTTQRHVSSFVTLVQVSAIMGLRRIGVYYRRVKTLCLALIHRLVTKMSSWFQFGHRDGRTLSREQCGQHECRVGPCSI